MASDKELEYQRYNERAGSLLTEDNVLSPEISGSDSLPPVLRAPYLCYESKIKEYAPGVDGVMLEIGAGTGAFTGTLLATEASVVATDISEQSLDVIRGNAKDRNNLQTQVADMEQLPFGDETFDVVTSAGSLSYGDNKIVMDEIYRVLKKDGLFICVDSLNHNPVYKLNRWLHFIRKNRTMSTLKRMPTVSLISEYEAKFGHADVDYFGALSWLAPLLTKLFSASQAAALADRFDILFNIKKSAFKFVMLAKKI